MGRGLVKHFENGELRLGSCLYSKLQSASTVHSNLEIHKYLHIVSAR